MAFPALCHPLTYSSFNLNFEFWHISLDTLSLTSYDSLLKSDS